MHYQQYRVYRAKVKIFNKVTIRELSVNAIG